MIDLYYWTTANGWKISIMLEECALPYRVFPIDLRKGEQHSPEFLKISPNNRIPAIVDHAPIGGGEPLAIFESGVILEYLADKTGKFLPTDVVARYRVKQWVAWQIAGLGPMAGQLNHFQHYASEKIDYAIARYRKELERLCSVLERQLSDHAFIASDEYTIADIASFGWLVIHERLGVDLDRYPNIGSWIQRVKERPAVVRGMSLLKELRPDLPSSVTG